jgi:hypothetical protein
MLATTIDFKARADSLRDPPLATAFLDRLVECAVILKLAGRSYFSHLRVTSDRGAARSGFGPVRCDSSSQAV